MKGKTFKPGEPYTHRLNKILEEYPDGSQILREILQNSDDSKSRSQTLCPALLSKNDAIFNERDFQSLLNLANSEKRNQYDTIGVMGPHNWYFDGGVRYNFITDNIATDYPNQFAPFINSFGIPHNKKINGTIFRYPLRTFQDANDSEISKNQYNPNKILEIFEKFYENESVNCLLFLNSVESIKFFELKKNESVPKLLYSIEIVNVKQVREKRDLIAIRISSLMKDLDENKLSSDETPRDIQWIIFGWLGDLNAAATHFNDIFKKKIIDYKLIPNVGIAIPLNEPETIGRLFCFLPLPILMPFRASIHGHFAVSLFLVFSYVALDYIFDPFVFVLQKVSTNRRTLWSTTDAEDLAEGTLAKLKVSWNEYLFNVILPQAWAKFLVYLPIEIPDINAKDFYSFWPVIKKSDPGDFFNNLLLNTIKNLKVFCGPPKSCLFGNMSDILPLDESADPIISKIIESIGFPVINVDSKIYNELKKSCHKDCLNICSPHVIRMYLIQNKLKWENLKRDDILSLFEYVLKDKNYAELDGLTMIPLSNGTFGTISRQEKQESQKKHYFGIKSKSKNLDFYIGPDPNNSIGAQEGWDLNIKILVPSVVATMIKDELSGYSVECDEIPLGDSYNWIFKIWSNFKERDYELTEFEAIHLLPTNGGTLRKLKTSRKCFWNSVDKNLDNEVQPLIEKLGIVFVNKKFEKLITYNHSKLSKYVIGLENLTEVLTSLNAVDTFPKNVQIKLKLQEAEIIINYLRNLSPDKPVNNDIKYLPIFSEVGKKELIALEPGKRNWYLLPSEDEKSYGKIITPNTIGFLDISTHNKRFLLEDIIKVNRLTQQEYWTKFVIPYLVNQTSTTLEIVIIKLFERLQLLLSENPNLKSDLGNMAKPIDLFDPDNHYISGLFFDDERLIPTRNFSEKYRDIFLTSLKSLGMKSWLSSSDVVQRLEVFAKRRKDETNINIVHEKSLKLVQYIDKNYDKLLEINQQQQSNKLSTILQTKEWLPTVDFTGKKQFSKADECRSIKDKYLVGLVMPIVEYSFENKSFIKKMQWNYRPHVDIVIAQLKTCYSMETIHENTFKICKEVYSVMADEIYYSSNSKKFREELKDENWIFCNGKFYPSHKVVIQLDKNLGSNTSVIVELHYAYKQYEELFKIMGVRQRIGIPYLIKIINEFNSKMTLSNDELHKVVSIIELIANRVNEQGGSRESLKDLLVPSTDCQLVNLYEIYYDDMKTRLDDGEKNGLKMVHSLISYYVAKTLGIKMLAGKFVDSDYLLGYGEDFEQREQLAVRIKNIISNADDAGAKKICFVFDNRSFNRRNFNMSNNKNVDKQNSLLSDEMDQWQGPALWIYNDSEFTSHDFESIKKLGMGGKRDDKTKIGQYGIGFNCAYHMTDLPSFVSGEHIVFFDPLQKFLPKTGNPPRSPCGTRINFIEKNFRKRFEDQASSYIGIFGCDFKKKFNGTLFRLPLRTKSSKLSRLTINSMDLKHEIFEYIEGNREMLFLRNIEQCSLYQMNKPDNLDLIWEAKIQNMNDIRELRTSHSCETKLYQLEMEIYNNSKFEDISNEINRSARGGVAALLSIGDGKSLEELKVEKVSNIPSLRGKLYSYLSLPMFTSLGVHINGTFCLSSDRKNVVIQADITNETNVKGKKSLVMSRRMAFFKNFFMYIKNRRARNKSKKSEKSSMSPTLTKITDSDGEWNRYVILDVLPPLHSKLFEHVTNQLMSPFNEQVFSQLWPITFSTSNIFREYGLNVLRELYTKKYKVFWSEANGGFLTSLDEAYFVASDDSTIADFLISRGVNLEIVKISEDKLDHINEMTEKMQFQSIKSITPKLVCSLLQDNPKILNVESERLHDIAFEFLEFITQDDYKQLNGLRLVPLCDKSLGTFGSQTYYIAEQELRKLFPNALSEFVADLPLELQEIFKDTDFCNELQIKSLDADSIIDLLKFVLKCDKEIYWNPSGKHYPNKYWIDKILLIFEDPDAVYELSKLSRFPIMPTCIPSHRRLPDNCNEIIKQCILQPTAMNMIKSLEMAIKKSSRSLQQLFDEKLDQDEIKKFRSFIKNEFIISENKSIKFVKTLPIWLTQSRSACISEKTNIFLIEPDSDESNSDFITLRSLGAKYIEPVEYVKEHLDPQTVTLDQQYIDFLKAILSLEKADIESYLSPLKITPNYHFTTLVRVDTLYNIDEPLFRRIFWNTDKLLHTALQGNAKLKLDAKFLMEYLYEHLESLNFTDDQWQELISIKFVPVDTDLESPLKETAFATTGFESINSICSQEYKLICWTQCPLFSKSIDPPNTFRIKFPESCRPTMNWVAGKNLVLDAQEDIRAGLLKVHDNLKEFKLLLKAAGAKEIKNIEFNVETQDYSQKEKLINELLDSFEEQDDTMHHDVVFQIHYESGIEKIKANRYVLSAASKHFKALFCGRMKESAKYQKVTIDIYDIEPLAFRVLIRWLHGQTLEEAIKAVIKDSNRVGDKTTLSMLQEHTLGDMPKRLPFYKKLYVFIKILRTKNKLKKSKASMLKSFSVHQTLDLKLCSAAFLVDLLKASDKYQADPLKSQVEVMIMTGSYVNINNAIEMNEWAKLLHATQLNNYCDQYIKENKSLLIEKKEDEIANAENEEDKRDQEDMLIAVFNS
ncbi:22758_t:CDS:10 [Dentiscutata erythropus]|uniref:22758_t:CDS:1 n=1 Tax=Dentiscutata erythropus TaxID=1348616 RepID=A0A9N9AFK2_9GLOM|nr:22758_t:CDS:10 [Dentiscutata erythropus]